LATTPPLPLPRERPEPRMHLMEIYICISLPSSPRPDPTFSLFNLTSTSRPNLQLLSPYFSFPLPPFLLPLNLWTSFVLYHPRLLHRPSHPPGSPLETTSASRFRSP
ncbi:hypothetical protein JDV02_006109, partial [Purpureocillium takamizusanense]